MFKPPIAARLVATAPNVVALNNVSPCFHFLAAEIGEREMRNSRNEVIMVQAVSTSGSEFCRYRESLLSCSERSSNGISKTACRLHELEPLNVLSLGLILDTNRDSKVEWGRGGYTMPSCCSGPLAVAALGNATHLPSNIDNARYAHIDCM